MAVLGNLRIKYKSLILIGVSVTTAAAMFIVANIGLSSIKDSLDHLLLATNVERSAYDTILQEKIYLLNADASTSNPKLAEQAYAAEQADIRAILETLDRIDAGNEASLKEKSQAARQGTQTYAALAGRGLAALNDLDALTKSLEKNGETATQQARDYMASVGDMRKERIAADIRQYTYLIRANEKRYMLTQKKEIWEKMLSDFASMMKNLALLENDATTEQEKNQVNSLHNAAIDYEKAAQKWVDQNNTLFKEILPQMKTQGDAVIKLGYDAARQSAESMQATRGSILVWLGVIGAAIAGGGVLLGLIIANAISRPVSALTGAMAGLAQGNTAIEIPGTEQRDEIGEMARSVQVFKANALERLRLQAEEKQQQQSRERRTQAIEQMTQGFDSAVSALLQQVDDAIVALQDTAKTMSGNADQTNSQATRVASATEEASANVQTVATAADQLSASIQEISRQVEQCSSVSQAAANEAGQTNVIVTGLAQSSAQIGEVVRLITDIASQTNLLALNATIEAARAGDAGKGFAVVAGEVKSLANQTAKATDDISAQISQVQAATQSAVEAIGGIVSRIGEINRIAAAIAAAVEQQSASTGEIARNVQQAAAGTREVSLSIGGVTQVAAITGQAAGQVLTSAHQLSQQTTSLKTEVSHFLASVRQA